MARGHVHSALGSVDDDGNFVPADVSREEIEAARAEGLKAIAALEHRAFGDLRPAEVEAASAAYLEPFVRGRLRELEAAGADVVTLDEVRHELARLLANQGRFSEAAEVHDFGRLHAAAALRPDDDWCDCEPALVDDGTGALRELVFESVEIVSEVHGGIVRRYRCKCCGHLNISPEAPPQDRAYHARVAHHGLDRVDDRQLLKG